MSDMAETSERTVDPEADRAGQAEPVGRLHGHHLIVHPDVDAGGVHAEDAPASGRSGEEVAHGGRRRAGQGSGEDGHAVDRSRWRHDEGDSLVRTRQKPQVDHCR
jgi:hypothetical protein